MGTGPASPATVRRARLCPTASSGRLWPDSVGHEGLGVPGHGLLPLPGLGALPARHRLALRRESLHSCFPEPLGHPSMLKITLPVATRKPAGISAGITGSHRSVWGRPWPPIPSSRWRAARAPRLVLRDLLLGVSCFFVFQTPSFRQALGLASCALAKRLAVQEASSSHGEGEDCRLHRGSFLHGSHASGGSELPTTVLSLPIARTFR